MKICAELFVNNLKSKDLHFDVDEHDDVTVVSFPYDGKVARLVFNGDDGSYLSLYMVYENIPEEKFVEAIVACNELNTQYKWATFYVDKDRDLMVHDDAILSVSNAAEEAFEIMLRILNIAKEAKPILMKAIYA